MASRLTPAAYHKTPTATPEQRHQDPKTTPEGSTKRRSRGARAASDARSSGRRTALRVAEGRSRRDQCRMAPERRASGAPAMPAAGPSGARRPEAARAADERSKAATGSRRAGGPARSGRERLLRAAAGPEIDPKRGPETAQDPTEQASAWHRRDPRQPEPCNVWSKARAAEAATQHPTGARE